MKRVFAAAMLLTLTSLAAFAGVKPLPLSPVPYELRLPENIAARLTTGPVTGNWAEEVRQAGADAAIVVFYEPETGAGETTILMSAYYFPAARFDAARKPDEPPRFGREVLREGGMVLSVAGPFDTIFDPATQDGQNVLAADGLIYSPGSYARIE